MPAGARSSIPDPSANKGKLRARSLPTTRPFTIAVVFTGIHYLGLITVVTSFILFFLEPTQLATRIIVGSIIFSGITWLMAFFKRRSAHCPLCKGTPLINSGALAHSKARRIFPFNHGVSAIISVIASQKFCCMYCGSYFDMMKIPSHLRAREEDYSE